MRVMLHGFDLLPREVEVKVPEDLDLNGHDGGGLTARVFLMVDDGPGTPERYYLSNEARLPPV